jgi:hypothetical protein
MPTTTLANVKTLEFLKLYKKSLTEIKSQISDENNIMQNVNLKLDLDRIIFEISLIENVLKSQPSSYNLIWMLAEYTFGVPEVINQASLQYDDDLPASANFKNICDSLINNHPCDKITYIMYFYWVLSVIFMILQLMYVFILLQPINPCTPYFIAIFLISSCLFILSSLFLMQISNIYDANMQLHVASKESDNSFFSQTVNNENVLSSLDKVFTTKQFSL